MILLPKFEAIIAIHGQGKRNLGVPLDPSAA